MAIEQKTIDISADENYASKQKWAEATSGIFMNMLAGVRYDTVRNKYVMAPIQYSTVNLEGEKIKFSSGQELMVVFSCLASEYANKKEVYDKWWDAAKTLIKSYKEQKQLEAHIESNNTDLKTIDKEGLLKDEDELNND